MRIIDADRLLEERRIKKYYHLPNGDIAIPIIDIKHAPTVEVVPVRKGKWKWKFADNGWKDVFCSECGWKKNVDVHVSLGYNFCPHCGADMRVGKDDE